MNKILLACMIVVLSGCTSVNGGLKYSEGQEYGYMANACQNLPEIASKIKEGLGDMKVCILAGAKVIIVPKDVEIR